MRKENDFKRRRTEVTRGRRKRKRRRENEESKRKRNSTTIFHIYNSDRKAVIVAQRFLPALQNRFRCGDIFIFIFVSVQL